MGGVTEEQKMKQAQHYAQMDTLIIILNKNWDKLNEY